MISCIIFTVQQDLSYWSCLDHDLPDESSKDLLVVVFFLEYPVAWLLSKLPILPGWPCNFAGRVFFLSDLLGRRAFEKAAVISKADCLPTFLLAMATNQNDIFSREYFFLNKMILKVNHHYATQYQDVWVMFRAKQCTYLATDACMGRGLRARIKQVRHRQRGWKRLCVVSKIGRVCIL